VRKSLLSLLSCLVLCTTYGLPAAAVVLLFQLANNSMEKFALCLLSSALVPILFVLIAGGWSLPFQRYIVPGKFPRELNHPIYFGRRAYGICWTSLYYCTPIYFLCLTFTPLRWLAFRLFGYRGPMNFAIYPDTWIRDLPLLHFGDGAYLSNRATVGTNIALSNGSILVDRVILKEGAYLGHLSMVAPGVVVGQSAEIGVGCAVGIKAILGAACRIGPGSCIGHGALLFDRVVTGAMCCIGSGTKIGTGLVLPNFTNVPNRMSVPDQSGLNGFVLSVAKRSVTGLNPAEHVDRLVVGSDA